jgi:hypothetical protein
VVAYLRGFSAGMRRSTYCLRLCAKLAGWLVGYNVVALHSIPSVDDGMDALQEQRAVSNNYDPCAYHEDLSTDSGAGFDL